MTKTFAIASAVAGALALIASPVLAQVKGGTAGMTYHCWGAAKAGQKIIAAETVNCVVCRQAKPHASRESVGPLRAVTNRLPRSGIEIEGAGLKPWKCHLAYPQR